MPIRINLKELFPADAQEISIDKINFNFNKLLELGIGEQGLRGFLGNQGSAGPGGIQGPDGTRGNIWFVGPGDPTIVDDPAIPDDLLPGDFYLDSSNFAVWQWDGTSWNFLFDLTAIINNYLAGSPSPFTRGLGIGSPNDDRFILFNRRSDNITDVTLGGVGGNNANNDILFLNNFDEDTMAALIPPGFIYGPAETPVMPQIGTETLYNSLLSIYVDHRFGSIGRYHVELGELYQDDTLPDPNPILTNVYENYKMRYLRVIPPGGVYSDHYNVAQFSMDIPETGVLFTRNFNGVFEFITPKANIIDSVNESAHVYIGSKYGLNEITGNTGNLADGILFYLSDGGINGANIGIAKDYLIANLPAETGYITNHPAKDYFMMTAASDLNGIYLNDDVLQNGGNIIQVATTEPRAVDVEVSANVSPSSFLGHMGIARDGNTIYTVSGDPNPTTLVEKYGYFDRFTIENPNNPISEWSAKFDGTTTNVIAHLPGCFVSTDSYNSSDSLVGPGAADIAIAGKYMYVVNNQHNDRTPNHTASPAHLFYRTYFQICELDSVRNTAPRRISRLGYGAPGGDSPELNSAYRVLIAGNHAVVATNGLYTLLGVFNTESLGGVTTINITDPTTPVVVNSAVPAMFESTVSAPFRYRENAILDMDIVDDKVITLTWQHSGGNHEISTDYQVRIDVFNLNNKTGNISWDGLGSLHVAYETAIPIDSFPSVNKRGAIVANKKYIYAGYGNKITIFDLMLPSAAGDLSDDADPCRHIYDKITELTLTIPSGTCEIYDMKQLGNSLYVLAVNSDKSTSYAFKVDVSGGVDTTNSTWSVTSPPTQVYCKDLNFLASRFLVVGKHIYVGIHSSSDDTTNVESLIAIDFDGIYTGGAHIESLRADQLDVTQNANIGGGLNVGGPVEIGDNLLVNGVIAGLGAVPIGVTVPFAGTTAPNGWLFCDGTLHSRYTYVTLFAALGTVYGSTSGTNFRVPNLKHRIPVGYDSATYPFDTVGDILSSTGIGTDPSPEFIVMNYIIYAGA